MYCMRLLIAVSGNFIQHACKYVRAVKTIYITRINSGKGAELHAQAICVHILYWVDRLYLVHHIHLDPTNSIFPSLL